MTDKVQKIREEVERLYNQSLVDENRQADRGLELAANVSYGKSKACKQLLSFIDSLQEEPVSEDLVSAANQAWLKEVDREYHSDFFTDGFKAGANWQKQHSKCPLDCPAFSDGCKIGMKEAKQQFINKACDWLKNWSYGYLIEKYGETDIDRNELVKDFKKYMEG